MHAIAVARIWETARGKDQRHAERARAFLRGNYPRLFAWHRYLATSRDPEGSGLVTIYHPWESGTDNSPRWDGALEGVEVGEVPPYPRHDLQHVRDPSERPTAHEYDRYLWLLELLKRARYDEATVYETHPFLVKDVLFSAPLVAANEALLEIAEVVEAPDEERAVIVRWVERARGGLEGCWDEDLGLCVDYDVRGRGPRGCAPSSASRPSSPGVLLPNVCGPNWASWTRPTSQDARASDGRYPLDEPK